MKIQSKYIAAITFALVLSTSCSESFLDSVPLDKISTETFYTNDDDFIKSINGVYSAFTPYRQDMEYFPMIDMATPIAVRGGGRFAQFQWGNSGFTPTNMHSDIYGWFANWYSGVARANQVLSKLDEKWSCDFHPRSKKQN